MELDDRYRSALQTLSEQVDAFERLRATYAIELAQIRELAAARLDHEARLVALESERG